MNLATLKPKRDETATLPISSDQRLLRPWTMLITSLLSSIYLTLNFPTLTKAVGIALLPDAGLSYPIPESHHFLAEDGPVETIYFISNVKPCRAQ